MFSLPVAWNTANSIIWPSVTEEYGCIIQDNKSQEEIQNNIDHDVHFNTKIDGRHDQSEDYLEWYKSDDNEQGIYIISPR